MATTASTTAAITKLRGIAGIAIAAIPSTKAVTPSTSTTMGTPGIAWGTTTTRATVRATMLPIVLATMPEPTVREQEATTGPMRPTAAMATVRRVATTVHSLATAKAEMLAPMPIVASKAWVAVERRLVPLEGSRDRKVAEPASVRSTFLSSVVVIYFESLDGDWKC